jgi:glycolate oxidase FAD binding subunit
VRVVLRGAEDALSEGARAAVVTARASAGDAYIERLPDAMRPSFDVWLGEPPGFLLMRRIKEEFDPRRTLNPGRFVGGL